MIEVEVKVPVSDLTYIENLLIRQDYKIESYIYESDTYYTSQYHDFRKLDEALRIRTIKDLNTNQKKSYITFKGAKLDEITMTRKELETSIEDERILKEILESIEMVPVPSVNKTRKTLVNKNINVCLDCVEKLGNFIEVEVLVQQESQREEAVEEIKKVLNKLDLSLNDTIRTSYLSMLENKLEQISH